MGSITVRKLPDDIKQELRELAARHGRSLEEEVRQALIALVRPQQDNPKSFFKGLYDISRPGFDDFPIPERTPARIPDLSEE
ncbi:hypothetical protein ACFOWX_06295 [Sphingorhabdus arenilitoris]|uniref:Antitoxin FitA-like ribbon-helix-helix domain-containing protein n=1 Tax=Sphingorhabdus arenilitoris TaxID=1490041 RepID=A0ABV8RF50_9SPHN